MNVTKWIRFALLFGFIPIFLSGDAAAQERRQVVEKRGYIDPQIISLQGDEAAFGWAHPVGNGHDLLFAPREASGAFGAAIRLNREPGDVRILPLDEARPAVVSDGDQRVGAAWFDVQGRLWARRSEDGGASFGSALRVDGGKGRPEHAFVHAAFDPSGVLHVAWLDTRDAPKGMEEPAQLYSRSIGPDRAHAERALTAETFASVCGCCRPHVRAGRFGVQVAFRGIEEGYRDIWVLAIDPDGTAEEPERVGPPRWKIDGCPMAGPITDGRTVLWRDGSRPRARIVEGAPGAAAPRDVIRVDDPSRSPGTPRWIADGGSDLLLVPGTPRGWILARDGGAWSVLTDDLPAWCTDALRLGDQILLIGDDQGVLEVQAFPLGG